MFQVIGTWNFARPDLEMKNFVDNITLRGYSPEVFLTGQFASKIKEQEIRSLSVSDIADRYCPTRRDLYYKKGRKRPRISSTKTWGRTAGTIVEKFVFDLFSKEKSKRNKPTYQVIRTRNNQFSKNFQISDQKAFSKLSQLKGQD